MNIKSPAKVNIYLKILGMLDNKFHNLETRLQLVSLFDHMSFSSQKNIDVDCIGANIKAESNIVYKAAKKLARYNKNHRGIKIEIKKNIPIGSGLGGGSSNAATTIVALNKIWGLNLSLNKMLSIGSSLGSDVPFFIFSQNAIGYGKGDILKKTSSVDENILIINPISKSLSSDMYKMYDERHLNREDDDPQNSFWSLFLQSNSEVSDFIEKYRDKYQICLSGSGSSMFVLCPTKKIEQKIINILPPKWRFFLTKPLQYSPLRDLI